MHCQAIDTVEERCSEVPNRGKYLVGTAWAASPHVPFTAWSSSPRLHIRFILVIDTYSPLLSIISITILAIMSGRYSQVPTDFVDDLESGRFEDSETLEKETLLPGTLEREDYDVPPPGSPPASQLHLDIGNTNGVAPGEPERPSAPRWSIFQRMFGAMVPSRYTRVPAEASAPLVGGGALNDGVFANMAARPQKNVAVRTDDGNVHMVPEDAQDALPPVSRLPSIEGMGGAECSYFSRTPLPNSTGCLSMELLS